MRGKSQDGERQAPGLDEEWREKKEINVLLFSPSWALIWEFGKKEDFLVRKQGLIAAGLSQTRGELVNQG